MLLIQWIHWINKQINRFNLKLHGILSDFWIYFDFFLMRNKVLMYLAGHWPMATGHWTHWTLNKYLRNKLKSKTIQMWLTLIFPHPESRMDESVVPGRLVDSFENLCFSFIQFSWSINWRGFRAFWLVCAQSHIQCSMFIANIK